MPNIVVSDTLTEAAALALKLCDDLRNLREYQKQGNAAVVSPLADTCAMRVAAVDALLRDACAAMGVHQGKVITLRTAN